MTRAPRSLAEILTDAQAGDPQAQYELAEAFATGDGAKEDLVLAHKYYAMASSNGHPDAIYELAWMNLKGEGMKSPNIRYAHRLFRRAAALGSTDSALVLGEGYLFQKSGLRRNKRGAVKYLLMALALGNKRAATLIADGLGEKGWISLEMFRNVLSKW